MRRILAVSVGLVLIAGVTAAQTPEAEVTAAFKRTLDAYNTGDTTTFNSMFLPTIRGFFLDKSVLTGPGDINAPAPAGPPPKPSLSAREVSVKVYGNAAVIAAYFVGTDYVGGKSVSGTWRFTETRIRDGGTWKAVQFHFSELDPDQPDEQ